MLQRKKQKTLNVLDPPKKYTSFLDAAGSAVNSIVDDGSSIACSRKTKLPKYVEKKNPEPSRKLSVFDIGNTRRQQDTKRSSVHGVDRDDCNVDDGKFIQMQNDYKEQILLLHNQNNAIRQDPTKEIATQIWPFSGRKYTEPKFLYVYAEVQKELEIQLSRFTNNCKTGIAQLAKKLFLTKVREQFYKRAVTVLIEKVNITSIDQFTKGIFCPTMEYIRQLRKEMEDIEEPEVDVKMDVKDDGLLFTQFEKIIEEKFIDLDTKYPGTGAVDTNFFKSSAAMNSILKSLRLFNELEYEEYQKSPPDPIDTFVQIKGVEPKVAEPIASKKYVKMKSRGAKSIFIHNEDSETEKKGQGRKTMRHDRRSTHQRGRNKSVFHGKVNLEETEDFDGDDHHKKHHSNRKTHISRGHKSVFNRKAGGQKSVFVAKFDTQNFEDGDDDDHHHKKHYSRGHKSVFNRKADGKKSVFMAKFGTQNFEDVDGDDDHHKKHHSNGNKVVHCGKIDFEDVDEDDDHHKKHYFNRISIEDNGDNIPKEYTRNEYQKMKKRYLKMQKEFDKLVIENKKNDIMKDDMDQKNQVYNDEENKRGDNDNGENNKKNDDKKKKSPTESNFEKDTNDDEKSEDSVATSIETKYRSDVNDEKKGSNRVIQKPTEPSPKKSRPKNMTGSGRRILTDNGDDSAAHQTGTEIQPDSKFEEFRFLVSDDSERSIHRKQSRTTREGVAKSCTPDSAIHYFPDEDEVDVSGLDDDQTTGSSRNSSSYTDSYSDSCDSYSLLSSDLIELIDRGIQTDLCLLFGAGSLISGLTFGGDGRKMKECVTGTQSDDEHLRDVKQRGRLLAKKPKATDAYRPQPDALGKQIITSLLKKADVLYTQKSLDNSNQLMEITKQPSVKHSVVGLEQRLSLSSPTDRTLISMLRGETKLFDEEQEVSRKTHNESVDSTDFRVLFDDRVQLEPMKVAGFWANGRGQSATERASGGWNVSLQMAITSSVSGTDKRDGSRSVSPLTYRRSTDLDDRKNVVVEMSSRMSSTVSPRGPVFKTLSGGMARSFYGTGEMLKMGALKYFKREVSPIINHNSTVMIPEKPSIKTFPSGTIKKKVGTEYLYVTSPKVPILDEFVTKLSLPNPIDRNIKKLAFPQLDVIGKDEVVTPIHKENVQATFPPVTHPTISKITIIKPVTVESPPERTEVVPVERLPERTEAVTVESPPVSQVEPTATTPQLPKMVESPPLSMTYPVEVPKVFVHTKNEGLELSEESLSKRKGTAEESIHSEFNELQREMQFATSQSAFSEKDEEYESEGPSLALNSEPMMD